MSRPGPYTSGTAPAVDVDFLDPVLTLAWDLLGNGTDAPTTKADAMANLFSGGVKINPTSDATALLVQGYSGSGSSYVIQAARYAGGKSVFTVAENANPITTIQSDDDAHVPLIVRGNSATQSSDLLHVYQYGSVPVLSVRANGGFDFTDPASTGYNTYINFNNGHQIVFFDPNTPDIPSIARYEAAGNLRFLTSSTDGAFDVTNMTLDNTGTTFSATAKINAGVRLNIVDSQPTVGAAGGASALPATPLGYAKIQINGTECVVPFDSPS